MASRVSITTTSVIPPTTTMRPLPGITTPVLSLEITRSAWPRTVNPGSPR